MDPLAILQGFAQSRILVLGDLMLDEYLWGTVTRISPEAPIPVVDVNSVSYAPGGASNVASNIASLGGKVLLFGVVGDDEAGRHLREELEKRGIQVNLLVDPSRPTTLKTRVIAHSQQVVRVDRESRAPISKELAPRLLKDVINSLPDVDAVLISDYKKGVTTTFLTQEVINAARKAGKMVLVDPKGLDWTKYQGATIVTPNEKEAGEAAGVEIDSDAALLRAVRTLMQMTQCRAVLVTRGEKGLALLEADGDLSHLPTFAREVYDVTGAGDTVVGTLALALSAGADFHTAACIANHAAGIVVGRVGTATTTREELERSIARSLENNDA